MNSVEVENISKSYGKVKALDNINLQVKTGELFGLIGPDGAGKTTLFRILTSLLLPDTGKAFLEGYDMVNDYKELRKIIGYMPGRFSLYQDLSVEENLKFFATVFGTTIEANYHLIEDIYKHIEPFKKRLAGRLSGGMKQKLALSCALIHKPKILILDEPTTGVDAVSRKEFWEMLKKIKDQNITILVSTPYMDEAGLCERVALIQNGCIMQVDTPQQIVDEFPRQLFSIRAKNFFKLINDLKAFNLAYSVYAFGQNIHFTAKQDDISVDVIENYLITKGNQMVEVEKVKAGIEDCFIDLMIKNQVNHD